MKIDNPAVNSGTATTQSPSDNSTKIATTAYTDAAVAASNQTTTGTTDRITITDGAGDPVVDIASTYEGQTSIIKLGSVTTGSWGGSTISVAAGGTGQTTANTAFNALAPDQTGNSGKYMTTDGTNTSWGTIAAGGDVVGPASATDNAVARYDSTTGKLLQNTSITIDDSNNIAMNGGSLNMNGTGSLDDSNGISFFTSNNDFKIGYDNLGGGFEFMRFNVDTYNTATCGWVWSSGDLSAGTETTNMLLDTTGLLTLGGPAIVSGDLTVNNGDITINTGQFNLNGTGNLDDSNGIRFFAGGPDYRMGFESEGGTKGYIRTNVDSSGSSIHGFVWSGGDLSAGTETDYMLLTTAGVLTVSGLGQINATSVACDNVACEAVDPDYIIYTDVKPSGTSGGTTLAASWQTRTLNTVDKEKDTSGSFSALSSNQFTLQAGRYKVRATVPTYMTQRSKAAIINVTDSTVAIVGNTSYHENGYFNGSHLTVTGEIDIAGVKAFEVWHYTQSAVGTYGLGVETTASGYAEKYTIVEIYRLGD